jgi:hypothetical protein
MARTPNYNFERQERDRLKAAKKAAKRDQKDRARESERGPSPAEGEPRDD